MSETKPVTTQTLAKLTFPIIYKAKSDEAYREARSVVGGAAISPNHPNGKDQDLYALENEGAARTNGSDRSIHLTRDSGLEKDLGEIEGIERDYETEIKNWKKRKSELLGEAAAHELRAKKLKAKVKEERPRSENSGSICKRCDINSMVYKGRTPQGGAGGGDDIYECEVCNYSPLLDEPY